jgi:signal transduction histidine kinase
MRSSCLLQAALAVIHLSEHSGVLSKGGGGERARNDRSTANRLQSPNARTDDRELLRFTVEDTGLGIPAEALATLFERFSQVCGAWRRRRLVQWEF